MPAMQAGIKVGDVITAVNGTAIRSTPAMVDILQTDERSAGRS